MLLPIKPDQTNDCMPLESPSTKKGYEEGIWVRVLNLLLPEALQEVIEALWVERADRPGQISAAISTSKSRTSLRSDGLGGTAIKGPPAKMPGSL